MEREKCSIRDLIACEDINESDRRGRYVFGYSKKRGNKEKEDVNESKDYQERLNFGNVCVVFIHFINTGNKQLKHTHTHTQKKNQRDFMISLYPSVSTS